MHISTKILAILVVFFITTSFKTFYEGQPATKSGYALKTVVIDAGHGGHDHGCSGATSKEKNVALSISLKLGALIEKNYPEVKVVYTRKTDVFIELHERANIANKANADLFICIHCNANPSSSPFGTETYVMGLHKTDANLGVAKRENDVILLEDDYKQHYDGFDPGDPASHIMFSLFQHAYMNQSILFAAKCEEQFKSAKRHSRGVKQAGFLVLWKTSMPSVLIETGFLTNTKEEKILASTEGQKVTAECIFRAFQSYKNDMENTGGKIDEKDLATLESEMDKVDTSEENFEEGASVNGVEYFVQYYASESELKTTDKKFSSLKNEKITYTKEGKWYKYKTGPYSTLNTATLKQKNIRNIGYRDAFVIAYKDGKKISLEEARTLQPQ
ncbi:MAG: N-acetylmuramoyl-L-alanine amidase [Chitinophagales bacterium]